LSQTGNQQGSSPQSVTSTVGPTTITGPLGISVSDDTGTLIAEYIANIGAGAVETGVAANFFKQLVADLPASLSGIAENSEFKTDLIEEFNKQEESVGFSASDLRGLGVSLVQTVLINAFADYIVLHYSPEVGEALRYGLNVAADTAMGAAKGGAVGAEASFATSVTVKTAIEVSETVVAYIKLNQTNSNLQTQLIVQGAHDVNLLAAAAINQAAGNTARANQEYALVNSSIASYAAQVKGTLAYSNEWTVISLLVQAKEAQVMGNSAVAQSTLAMAMDTANTLNQSQGINLLDPVNYVALANTAAKTFGLE
jgi:hypothetical protein